MSRESRHGNLPPFRRRAARRESAREELGLPRRTPPGQEPPANEDLWHPRRTPPRQEPPAHEDLWHPRRTPAVAPAPARWWRRRHLLAAVAAAAAVLAVLAAVLVAESSNGAPSPVAKLPFSGIGAVSAVAFSPNGEILANGDDDGNVYLWDVQTKRFLPPLSDPKAEASISAVAFSPNGQTLAVGDTLGNIYLYSLPSMHRIATLTGTSTDGVLSVAFSPGSATLASASNLGAYLWNVSTGLLITALKPPGGAIVGAVTFSPNGRTVAVACVDGSIYLMDTADGHVTATLRSLASIQEGGINSVAFSPDGQILAAGSGDPGGAVFVWDVATTRLIATLIVAASQGPGVLSLAFSPNGETLATGDGNGKTYLWPTASLSQPSTTLSDPGGKWVNAVALSPNGDLLATGDSNNSTFVWPVG